MQKRKSTVDYIENALRRGPIGSDYHQTDIDAALAVEGRQDVDRETSGACRFGGNCERCKEQALMETPDGPDQQNASHL